MPNKRTAGPAASLDRTPGSVLDVLTADERSAVLAAVLEAHPHLSTAAVEAARELLADVTAEDVALDVSSTLRLIPLEDLGARAGRVRGRGYVHETDAAWELVREAVEPFFADLRRRASLGLMEAAGIVATGIIAGLYQLRDPDAGTVLAYAGPDVLAELADQAVSEAQRLGIVITDDTAKRYWPRWTDLT